MNPPRLMILSDAAVAPGSPGEGRWFSDVLPTLLDAARPGSVIVQLRHKEAEARRRFELGMLLRRVTADRGQKLVVNDRADIARAVAADGLHLPEEGLSVAQARALLGPCAWVSRAWHGDPWDRGPATRPATRHESPDLWVLSPALSPRKGRPALGRVGIESALRHARAASAGRGPAVFGLGGATADNAQECLDAGLQGVAVIGAAATLEGALALVDALGLRAGVQR